MAIPLRIALIDDDADYAQVLTYRLQKASGREIRHFESGEAALASFMADYKPDLIFLDLVMPGLGGMETLKQLRDRHPTIPVVMVSAQSMVRVALDAIALGAYDYLTKGQDDLVKVDPIAVQIEEQLALRREVEVLRERGGAKRFSAMIGESQPMARVFHLVDRAVKADLAVAITGKSGTGKELVAEAIHAGSPRSSGPFVVVNCAAIPNELMESEFFGHEKGAFTGAHARRAGVFEQADGGTLFLDEIGEFDRGLQAKLLRTLQDGRFKRVGGTEMLEADVRIISATNRSIKSMVANGGFREDLYYRLFQFPIQLPQLRDRGNDILLLTDHFLREFLRRHNELAPKRLSTEARRSLLQFDWPGNVRELRTTIERAALLADGGVIEQRDLYAEEPSRGVESPLRAIDDAATEETVLSMEEAKRRALAHAYGLCEGNVDRTATRLGITRSTVYRLLKKYGLEEAIDA